MVFLGADHLMVVIFRIILLVILAIGTEKEVGNELQLLFIVSLEVVFHKLDVFRIIDTSEEFGIGAIALSSLLVAAAVLLVVAVLLATATIFVAVTSTLLDALVRSLRLTAADLSLPFPTFALALRFGRGLITSCSASASLDISIFPGPLPCVTFPLIVPPVDFCGLFTIMMCVTRCV